MRSVEHYTNEAGACGSKDAMYVAFEPGAPKFKATRLRDALRALVHVLEASLV